MKIGILTFHDGINHGTYLQVYALSRMLSINYSTDEIKVINYKNNQNFWNEYKIFIFQKNIFNVIRNILKILKFKKIMPLLKLTKFISNYEEVNKENFDIIIYGSDEIWNYSHSFIELDKIYFGFGLICKNKISYAPSFSEAEFKNLPKELENFPSNFKHLSVRDSYSKNIIQEINDTLVPKIVLDPTFLYDFNQEVVNNNEKKFILLYCAGLENDFINRIIEFSKEAELVIIAIGYKMNFAKKNIISLDPFEWIGYFKSAEYVITNTFHGTVFSIKYNKKFVSIPKEDKKNKIVSILNRFDLSNRLCMNEKFIKNILVEDIDYFRVNKLIENYKKESLDFLSSAISRSKI